MRIFGRVLPERRSYWFEPVTLEERSSDGRLVRRLEASADMSSFSATLWTSEPDPDEATLKNHLEGFLRGVLDSLGLILGEAIDCDVVQVQGLDGTVRTLDRSFPGLSLNGHSLQDTGFSQLCHVVRGLRLGLADFRLAIQSPDDTLFLCYRGIEGIRADFAEAENLNRDRAWERTREVTGLTRAEINAIKPVADARRHGSAMTVTHDQRAEALRLLQRGLLGYAAWVKAQPLPPWLTLL